MLIEFLSPIVIKLSVEEVEDRLPSFRVNAVVEIEQSAGELKYTNSDIWFDCSDWDRFVEKLTSLSLGSSDKAVLKDMGENLVLQLDSRDDCILFSINFVKKSPYSGALNFSYETKIDNDVLTKYKDALSDFPKWW